MHYTECLDYINSFSAFHTKLGTQRMANLLHKMGNPQNSLRFVHIAGTNGKGSTSTMLSNLLTRSRYKTGLFISPYVLCFRERMQINGEMISQDELCRCTEYVKPFVDELIQQGESIIHFELITLIAFVFFNSNGCDIVCLEVGLGGRFDATNVIACPLLQIITAIDYDHTSILGDSIEEIAYEKAGIIKGSHTVIYPLQQQQAKDVLLKKCNETGSNVIIPNTENLVISDSSWKALDFEYDGLRFKKRLPGIFQCYNSITVYHAALILRQKGFNISNNDIIEGIESTFFPARMEIIRSNPLIILDGAHNPSGIKALCDVVNNLKTRRINIIIGLLADRDYDEMLSLLLPLATNVITLAVNSPRALSSEALLSTAQKHCNSCYSFCDAKQAVDFAAEITNEQDTLIACGSLYLAAELRELLLKI